MSVDVFTVSVILIAFYLYLLKEFDFINISILCLYVVYSTLVTCMLNDKKH